MYNGIGLQTPRGSGTNGHVQRNWALVKPSNKDKLNYRSEEELAKLDAASNRQPNKEILDHERKRKIELKCVELEEILEEKGYAKGIINSSLYGLLLMVFCIICTGTTKTTLKQKWKITEKCSWGWMEELTCPKMNGDELRKCFLNRFIKTNSKILNSKIFYKVLYKVKLSNICVIFRKSYKYIYFTFIKTIKLYLL